MVKVSEMSDEELIKEANGLYSMIYVSECYGSRDILNFDFVCEKLQKRGFSLREHTCFEIEKNEEDEDES